MNLDQRAECQKDRSLPPGEIEKLREMLQANPELRAAFRNPPLRNNRCDGYLIPNELLPPGGINALPPVINGPVYQLYESEELARDDTLRMQAVSLRGIYGVKTPIIEGMSLQDTLRMRELMGRLP
jgi:hypothetical protein